jgi:hypothetical protein
MERILVMLDFIQYGTGSKNGPECWALVAHAYNPGSGGRGQRQKSRNQPWAK